MKLLFIYNAKSSISNRLFDYAHKIINPSSYSCDLCKLTHSNLGERKEWANFINETSADITFYHKDEFEEKYKQSFDYPIIINEKSEIILDKSEISNLKTVTELINQIKCNNF